MRELVDEIDPPDELVDIESTDELVGGTGGGALPAHLGEPARWRSL